MDVIQKVPVIIGVGGAGMNCPMKTLILADIDDLHWRGGRGIVDLVISLGDTADSLILEAARAFQCDRIFAVKGNHDRDTPFPSPILDMHLTIAEMNGITFGGLNGSWKYKPRGSFLYDQDEVAALLSSLPAVDVLISHNSPLGVHDKTDGVHTGFQALNEYLKRIRPRLLIHGHQHVNVETHLNQTRVIGVYGHRLLDRVHKR